jgi:anti-anti-sigma regulatory factor
MANNDASSKSTDSRRSGRHEAALRDYIAVARGSDLVVIRVVGSGNMLTAPGLSEFAEEQIKAGFKRFVFDLERCRGLDSTFMGVMVGLYSSSSATFGLHAKVNVLGEDLSPLSPEEAARELKASLARPEKTVEDVPANTDSQISAVNVPPEIKNLMAMLGVDKFVKIRGVCDLKQLETTILPEKIMAPNERRKLILKAHETLVEIDKRNEAQFGAFLKSLSSELAKG